MKPIDFVQELPALAVYRGRVAMYIMLKALGVGSGDEVALQAFTCLAVPEGIMATGAKPLFVDIETGGFNLAASDLRKKLTPKTKAIVVQHTFGIPADMDGILAVAKEKGLPVIEDCCHTLLTRYHGGQAGRFGVGAFYSFEWGKPIVTGIGGSAIVNDPELRQKVQQLYSAFREPPSKSQLRLQIQYLAHAVLYRPSLFWPVRSLYHKLGSVGAAESNYNPVAEGRVADDFSLKMAASLRARLSAKLPLLEQITTHSRQIAEAYKTICNPAIQQPVLDPQTDPVFARYPLRATDKSALLAAARKANVELADWYATPIHPLGPAEWHKVNYSAQSCPNAELRCREIVTLPTHRTVAQRDVKRACAFFERYHL